MADIKPTLASTRERRKIGTITYTEEPLEDNLVEKPGNYFKRVTVYCALQVRTKQVIIVFPSAKKKTDPEPVSSAAGKSFYRKPPTKSAVLSPVPVVIAPTTEGTYQLPA